MESTDDSVSDEEAVADSSALSDRDDGRLAGDLDQENGMTHGLLI
jgi:hypothetical protein